MQNSIIIHEIKFNDKVIAIAELFFKEIQGILRPILKITTSRAKKPYVNHYFKDENERALKLSAYEKRLIEIELEKIERRSSKKIQTEKFKEALKVGDILSCSWGWEQTNVDFYQVVSINDKKTKVIIQEMSHITVDGSEQSHGMACSVNPGEVYGPKIEKTITGEYIKLDRSVSLSKWDGKACYKSWYA